MQSIAALKGQSVVEGSRSSLAGFTESGSIDPETKRAIERLRFAPDTEAEFRAHYLELSLPRLEYVHQTA